MTAKEKLVKANQAGKYICVGLDTDFKKIPEHLKKEKDPFLCFNEQIIEATSENSAAYKLNFAFYEKFGTKGFEALEKTIALIPSDVLIIGDAKRGDIGNTSTMYAESIFDYFKCDSITLHPYMGEDSVKPFLNFSEKLIFILALTSNSGSQDFEKLRLEDGSYLFQKVISTVRLWNTGNCGIVFGATRIEELKENMSLIGDLPVLLPGVGAQGGSLKEVVQVFGAHQRKDFLINVSRGIIYKSAAADFARAAKEELLKMNTQTQELLNK